MESVLQMPGWVLIWFYLTAAICTWDASFIVFRPHSLPGGSLAYIWYLYKHYVTVDQRYSDLKDDFVFAQSLLNYVEVVLNIVAIIMHYRKCRHTLPLAFTVTVMTFWKTVLYFLMYVVSDTYRQNNTTMEHIFLFIIPNGFWIVVPFIAMAKLWSLLLPRGANGSSTAPSTRRRKTKAT
ncbi:uncharacterized protein LOC110447184 [Mizuhopecten yessoensis]|uniref:uncharacterized protein LOC110447184 n=1 Tax=Mizuhopecten yessoensis TaxID=6573 RepID=UPI000B45D8D2|nr:uncharacterized protein LOC110447184 [Mizuhopecten yessoensis]